MGRAPSHKHANIPKPKWAVVQDNFRNNKKFPSCKGTFPDCPNEISQDSVPSECKTCPLYEP